MKYILLLLCCSFLAANEIGFDEWFNLQKDRSESLKQLIPGTKEYYYYHALYYQQQKQYPKVKEILTKWIENYGTTSQVREIENRQALLDYEKNPQESLQHIVETLGISFDHQKRQVATKVQYPSSLNQNLIATEKLFKYALAQRRYRQIHNSSWEFFVNENLSPNARRHMLKNLTYPDHERLPALVVEDLQYRYSRGFGSLKIHSKLLLKQLEECLKRMPQLINNNTFIQTYIRKLHPHADSNWQQDDNEHRSYLYKLWKFAKKLPPAQNSLKAHILYNYLLLNLRQGKYPKALFMSYIKLPRNDGYSNEEFFENAEYEADTEANYSRDTGLKNIDGDDTVINEYLLHFFKTADNYDEYSRYIDESILKELFAESKITNGVGDKEQWYSLLSVEDYQRLTNRVDLKFTVDNQQYFRSNDKVQLKIAVKNVKDLIVKTYVVHTKNYYTKNNDEVNTAIDLDGLIANHEQVMRYHQVAQIRHIETLDFPHIQKSGVYIIECIGNGKSSRALIRKGNLMCIERVGAAGHVFSVYDDQQNLLKTAQIHYGNRLFSADKDGEITIPFSKRPGQQKYIVSHNNFSMLKTFQHQAENYKFSAGIYIDREQLLRQKSCQIIVRPRLYVNNNPISISLLEDVTLQIETTNRDGIQNTQDIKDFKLSDSAETTYTFKVPEKLQKITVTLSGKVENISKGSKENLSRKISHQINSIDSTYNVEDLFLRRVGKKYILQVLGKTGEAREKRIVKIKCQHRHFTNTIHVTLQTNKNGHVDLGKLQNIQTVSASGADNVTHHWYLHNDKRSYPQTLHIATGEKLSLPILDDHTNTRDICSLLELRNGTFVSEKNANVSQKNGFLQIENLSAGDYHLWLKKARQRITIRVATGSKKHHTVVSAKRYLELRNRNPLHIVNITQQKNKLRVQLRNHQKNTRVHIIATHFVPEMDIFSVFGGVYSATPQSRNIQQPISIYLSGRNIGDEYRYILNRKYAKKYPGNSLARPSLLLNPWSLRDTHTTQQTAESGERWGDIHKPLYGTRNGSGIIHTGAPYDRRQSNSAYSNFDFLQNASLVLANLKPDKNGVVELTVSTLQPRQHIHVVAVDHDDIVYREWGLARDKDHFRDLRLAQSFDRETHFAERKETTAVLSGRLFNINDITTSKIEVYDSLQKVHSLFSVLTKNEHLQKFDFVLRWPQLDTKEKNRLYSEHACHELNFFLYQKDRKYFNNVIKPYLKNKKHKTFIDHWLLENDLKKYLKPWHFHRLNVVERILLGQRHNGTNIFRQINDVNLLRNVNVDDLNRRYRTAIQLSSLTTQDDLGLDRALDEVTDKKPLPDATEYDEEKESEEYSEEEAMDEAEEAGDEWGDDEGDSDDDWDDGAGDDSGEEGEWDDNEVNEPTDGPAFSEKDIDVDRKRDEKRRKTTRSFYRGPEKTKEWVENNYYHRRIEEQVASLIRVNNFWRDYAAHRQGPFLSGNFIEATQNFSEMMFALAVLDLPFTAKKHQVEYIKEKMTLSPGSAVIVFHQQIQKSTVKNKNSILTRQRFFPQSNPYIYVDNQRVENFIDGEFQVGKVYGCQIIITNPTSRKRKINVLMQIPQGAIPIHRGFVAESRYYELNPYATEAIKYYFYFPFSGNFALYPVHISENETIIAHEKPQAFKVVKVLSQQDTTSWDYISQHATQDEVIRYLRTENLSRIDLQLIAFRMKDASFFSRAIAILQQRQAYNNTLWSYSLKHNDPQVIRQYLPHTSYANGCGDYIDSQLLSVNPVERHRYQHREYWPLVHPRVNQLGSKRQILNQQFFIQYQDFMKYMRYRPNLSDEDLLTCAMYLLLQDRVDDVLAILQRVDHQKLETQIQYDYLQSYMAFYLEKPQNAKEIANKYKNYPVERWRAFFSDVLAQIDELESSEAKQQKQEGKKEDVVKNTQDFDFVIEQRQIRLQYHNIADCQVNYYPMDLELLFSRNPFVKSTADQFSIIHPNSTQKISLDKKQQKMTHALPQKYVEQNVLVEVVAGGKTKAQAYYPHNLKLHVAQNYGQLQVRDAKSNSMLKKVYVKVYAKYNDGTVQFYKDGYTDLRGRFDYASLSTDNLDRVQMFSILILSEKHGAIVREVKPPKM
ncbi:hypothetical protein [Candidatus Uabimicrobium amorphum]|uniref:Uncharacterized protein n=1 Tax=Uabimicrobium amorphum TaxID=2596890 RepID=A0A5S9F1H1_UABAM|nr:hypothetical protein [Candidatus Uabimicrobium amorphum]BBM82566.1 hypothetical protein UABAM_00909 [Candidatus Uabimicrobium amorphum]